MNEPCDVEGCGNNAVAELIDVDDADDHGRRCTACLRFDLNL